MHAHGNQSSFPSVYGKDRSLSIPQHSSSSSSSTMGRKKLPIMKIEDEPRLQITYSKRKQGIIKKAYEMSVLSNVDAAFISFSQAGRLSFFSGGKSVEDIFERYMNMSESRQNYTPEEQEHILEILNVIRQQSGSSSCQNSETKALWEQIKRKQEELTTANANMKKFEIDDAESIMSLADIESHEKLLVDILQLFSHRKGCLFQTQNWLDCPTDQNYVLETPTLLDGPSKGQDCLIQESGWVGTQLTNQEIQADADRVLPTSVPVDWNLMPQGTLSLNAPRPSLNSVYRGLGQPPYPQLCAQNASNPSLPSPQVSSSSAHPNNSVLSNPIEGMPQMEMPLRAARDDEGLENFTNLAEYSSFSSELEF